MGQERQDAFRKFQIIHKMLPLILLLHREASCVVSGIAATTAFDHGWVYEIAHLRVLRAGLNSCHIKIEVDAYLYVEMALLLGFNCHRQRSSRWRPHPPSIA
jgi:hypothetical protein